MLDAGRYLVQKFYDDNYDLARRGKKVKKESLNQLIKKLQENSGDAPSKTWIYDAVKLAVDQHDYENFRTYGNLGHSQKLLLTHVKDGDKKKALIEEAVEKNYTVVDLRKRIRQEKGKPSADRISLQEYIPAFKLEILDLEKLEKIKRAIQEKLAIYQTNFTTINQVLEIKAKEDYAN
jgi:hypothetical protein